MRSRSVELGRGRFAPQFQVVGHRLVHRAQADGQRPPQLLGKFAKLQQLERVAYAQVLQVPLLDTRNFVAKLFELGWRHLERKTKLGIELAEGAFQHGLISVAEDCTPSSVSCKVWNTFFVVAYAHRA